MRRKEINFFLRARKGRVAFYSSPGTLRAVFIRVSCVRPPHGCISRFSLSVCLFVAFTRGSGWFTNALRNGTVVVQLPSISVICSTTQLELNAVRAPAGSLPNPPCTVLSVHRRKR
jgi:hypothetical protein